MSDRQYSTDPDVATDLAVVQMLAGASFGPNASLTLPSGLTLDASAANTVVNESGQDGAQ